MRHLTLTAVLEREGDGYVALCPEIDVASQGDTLDDARANLREAVELFLDTANSTEITGRFSSEKVVEPLEVTVG